MKLSSMFIMPSSFPSLADECALAVQTHKVSLPSLDFLLPKRT